MSSCGMPSSCTPPSSPGGRVTLRRHYQVAVPCSPGPLWVQVTLASVINIVLCSSPIVSGAPSPWMGGPPRCQRDVRSRALLPVSEGLQIPWPPGRHPRSWAVFGGSEERDLPAWLEWLQALGRPGIPRPWKSVRGQGISARAGQGRPPDPLSVLPDCIGP